MPNSPYTNIISRYLENTSMLPGVATGYTTSNDNKGSMADSAYDTTYDTTKDITVKSNGKKLG